MRTAQSADGEIERPLADEGQVEAPARLGEPRRRLQGDGMALHHPEAPEEPDERDVVGEAEGGAQRRARSGPGRHSSASTPPGSATTRSGAASSAARYWRRIASVTVTTSAVAWR